MHLFFVLSISDRREMMFYTRPMRFYWPELTMDVFLGVGGWGGGVGGGGWGMTNVNNELIILNSFLHYHTCMHTSKP